MSCTRDRWLSVFVTKPDTENGDPYGFDDEFMCTMRSVELSEDVSQPESDTNVYRAAIVGYATQYLLPTWSANYKEGCTAAEGGFSDNLLRTVAPGDMIRVGNPSSGHTDYLTVMEVIHVSEIWNATGSAYRASDGTPGKVAISVGAPFNGENATLEQQESDTNGIGVGSETIHVRSPEDVKATNFLGNDGKGKFVKVLGASKIAPINGQYIEPGTAGIAHIVLRVNARVQATQPPASFYSNAAEGMMKFPGGLPVAMENLHKVISPITHKGGPKGQPLVTYNGSSVATPGAETALEVFPYPVYLNKDWASGSTLYAKLDHGVKGLACIKLVGYSIVNKRQTGTLHQNELINDDYFVLSIVEIEGKIVSNNKHANGAFAVLHVPVGDQSKGAMEHSQFDPDGIVTHYFDNCDSTIRNLTIKVTDRKGQPAHIGRLHLWFKLLVLHG